MINPTYFCVLSGLVVVSRAELPIVGSFYIARYIKQSRGYRCTATSLPVRLESNFVNTMIFAPVPDTFMGGSQ